MNNSERERAVERELGRHFARMRTEDSAELPPFPDDIEQVDRRGGDVLPGRRIGLLRMGLAASVLFAVAVLVRQQSPAEDPAALYADIMSAYPLETEELLYVSESTTPGMTGLPDIIAPETSSEIDELTN